MNILSSLLLWGGDRGVRSFIIPDFLPILFRYEQHSEAFPIKPVEVLMVHFMRPANSANIGIAAAGKPFHALMNNNIMYQEVGKSICHNTEPYRLHPPLRLKCAEIYQQHAGNGKNDKEGIVLFKETWFRLVMIPMQVPEEPMHNILMRSPGYSFHEDERENKHQYV